MKRYYIFFAVMAAIAVLAITSNILLRRGPVHDSTAVEDIRLLQSAVDTYYLSQSQLPPSLSDLDLTGQQITTRLRDYDYTRVDGDTYQICATFLTAQTRDTGLSYNTQVQDPGNHSKGRDCFSATVLPIKSPLYPR